MGWPMDSGLALAICASTILSGCTSPLGRVRHQKSEDLRRRLEPNYKESAKNNERVGYDQESLQINGVLEKPVFRTPSVERLAGHLLKEYITRVYFEEEWPYQVWQLGNNVSDWIDGQLQFDFYGFKGDITTRTNEIGITFSKEF